MSSHTAGLLHIEPTVHALIEIIHAFTVSDKGLPEAATTYIKLLLAEVWISPDY